MKTLDTSFMGGVTSTLAGFFNTILGVPLAGQPYEVEIMALTEQLRLANREGRFADAQGINQQIRDLQSSATGMINPVSDRLLAIENSDKIGQVIDDSLNGVEQFGSDAADALLSVPSKVATGAKVFGALALVGLAYYVYKD